MNEKANAVEEVINKRRSTRQFDSRPLDDDDLRRILESGIAAPSGSNSQNQRFLVVTDSDEIVEIGKKRFVWPYKGANQMKMREKKPGGILGNAAALVIVFSDCSITEGRNLGEYYIWESLEIQNCSAAIENMLIMATALGVGSCWVSASDRMNHQRMFSGSYWQSVFKDYCIGDSFKLQGIVLLGYPKQIDNEGYPMGEKMHGATVWRSVERKPLSHYLVDKKDREAGDAASDGSFQTRYLTLLLSKLIRLNLKFAKLFDKAIWKLELKSAAKVRDNYQEGSSS